MRDDNAELAKHRGKRKNSLNGRVSFFYIAGYFFLKIIYNILSIFKLDRI